MHRTLLFIYALVTTVLGYGASWHPSCWQQKKMADELTPFLRQLMEWK